MDAQQALKQYVDALQPSFMGKVFYRCLPFRRRVIEENIHRVFANTLNDKQMKRLA